MPLSGDLGLTPGEVEKSLKEIFRFAQLWSCVLLLDECDIFLAQRTKTDIKRNSLVSGKQRPTLYPGWKMSGS
jgi:SpoVK/Ycf46/Vps4 family AAA+-type ATPase